MAFRYEIIRTTARKYWYGCYVWSKFNSKFFFTVHENPDIKLKNKVEIDIQTGKKFIINMRVIQLNQHYDVHILNQFIIELIWKKKSGNRRASVSVIATIWSTFSVLYQIPNHHCSILAAFTTVAVVLIRNIGIGVGADFPNWSSLLHILLSSSHRNYKKYIVVNTLQSFHCDQIRDSHPKILNKFILS